MEKSLMDERDKSSRKKLRMGAILGVLAVANMLIVAIVLAWRL